MIVSVGESLSDPNRSRICCWSALTSLSVVSRI